jgi:hypothetical protein
MALQVVQVSMARIQRGAIKDHNGDDWEVLGRGPWNARRGCFIGWWELEQQDLINEDMIILQALSG